MTELTYLNPFRSVLRHVLEQIAQYVYVKYWDYKQNFTVRRTTKKMHAMYCWELNHKQKIIKSGGLM